MKKIQELEASIGVTFQDKSLLKQALTHRSYLNEIREKCPSNERLEFLGDAILSFIVSNYLYKTFPQYSEGELTNIRSSIVQTKTLAYVSKKFNIGNFLLLSKGEEESGGRENNSLLEDCFEALLGAIFLDQGLAKTKSFLNKHLLPLLPEIMKRDDYRNYKSLFQERVQEKLRKSPVYKVLKEQGPDHDKTFYIGVYINEDLIGSGKGKSKQKAEQQAARNALEKWPGKG